MNDIILRDLTLSDLETVRIWRNSPEVSQYMYSDEQITAEQQERWFDKVRHEENSQYWTIVYDRAPRGVASLNQIDQRLESCYWAFYLGDTSVRGAGLGAKVEYQVINYVFEVLKLNKLRCEVFTFNDKIIRMHEKFGFRREAYYREHCRKNGKFEDVVGLALLRSEWTPLKATLQTKLYGT